MKKVYFVTVVLVMFVGALSAEAKSLPMKKVKTVKTEWVPVESIVDDSVEVIEAVEMSGDEQGAVAIYEGDSVPQDNDVYEYVEVEPVVQPQAAPEQIITAVPDDEEQVYTVVQDGEEQQYVVAEDKDEYDYSEVARPQGSEEPVVRTTTVGEGKNKRPVIQVIYQTPEDEMRVKEELSKKRWVRKKKNIEISRSEPGQGFQATKAPGRGQGDVAGKNVYYFYFNSNNK